MLVNIIKSKLFKDTALYSIINIIDKAIPFLIMPIISRALSKEDMGCYSLYQVTFHVLIPIITLSLDYPISINYFKMNRNDFSSYFSTGMVLVLIIYALLTLIGMGFSSELSTIFGLEEKWLQITFIIIILNYFNQLRMNLWRIQKDPYHFGLFSVPLAFIKNVLGLIFILYFDFGWEGIIIGHLIGQVLFSIIAIYTFIRQKYLFLCFYKQYVFDFFKVGVPVSIHKISAWLTTSVNRIIVNSILGTAATGSFGIGATFGTIVTVIEDAVNKAYSPHLFEKLAKFNSQNASSIVRLISFYYACFIFLGFFMSLVGYWGVGIIFGDKYVDTRSFVIPIIIGAVINGLYKIHVNIIFFTKKTYIVARNTLFCALINVCSAYFLVGEMGLLGAAYSTAFTEIVLYILTLYYANKQYKLPWQLVLSRKLEKK